MPTGLQLESYRSGVVFRRIEPVTHITVAGRAIAIAVGVPYLVACSSSPESMVGPDDSRSPGDDDTDNNSVFASISSVDAGHTHTAQLPSSDVSSTMSKNYPSSSAGGHTHTVTFTADDFDTLRIAGQVTISSSSDSGHTHSFTFST